MSGEPHQILRKTAFNPPLNKILFCLLFETVVKTNIITSLLTLERVLLELTFNLIITVNGNLNIDVSLITVQIHSTDEDHMIQLKAPKLPLSEICDAIVLSENLFGYKSMCFFSPIPTERIDSCMHPSQLDI